MSQNINIVKKTVRKIRAQASWDNTIKADQATSDNTEWWQLDPKADSQDDLDQVRKEISFSLVFDWTFRLLEVRNYKHM